MNRTYYKIIIDLKNSLSKGLLLGAGVADNKRLSKTNSDTPNRKMAFFTPEICLASQAGHNNSVNTSYPFTGVNRHKFMAHLPAVYVRKTSQNKPNWRICGADTVSSESGSEHPMTFHSVLLTQNLTGGHNHA